MRPSGTNVHLSEEEAAKTWEETRCHFDELAPKRHAKSQRSEYSSQYTDTLGNSLDFIPELVRFQQLENDPRNWFTRGLMPKRNMWRQNTTKTSTAWTNNTTRLKLDSSGQRP
ncbi:hypothetical protein NE237_028550 [Protea cynaroides]|uniref:Uncharacterized protein n=1 Tax=Protea cynaroides TaxID=273540 RepID=A0A9Q0GQ38_9MAGN|nr:hypothetical protein NE237_028550 [Protea cynaroides]